MSETRRYWIEKLLEISKPVLFSLAECSLKQKMPCEINTKFKNSQREHYTHLEAFARTICGIAPWLECIETNTEEAQLQNEYCDICRTALANATNKESPDFLNFTVGEQPLVDTAFLAYGLLLAKNELWIKLDSEIQKNVIHCFKSVPRKKMYANNWILFPAMIETFFLEIGVESNIEYIENAIKTCDSWYIGDGSYGDGPKYVQNYYNSFVIHPFLFEIIKRIKQYDKKWSPHYNAILTRALRYAEIQEAFIFSDGSFPAIGRSITYRCGVFHHLAHMALLNKLPKTIQSAQVRCGLTAVIKRVLNSQGTLDENGWLQIGFIGKQPFLAEDYISTGSLYMCLTVFHPLGLPPSHSFWTNQDTPCSSQIIWSGK